MWKLHNLAGSNSLYHWYEYDVAGREHRVFSNTTNSKPSTADITTTYTPAGGVASQTFGGNSAQPYRYDIRGRLTRLGDVTNPYHPFSASYTYAGNGRITQAEFLNNASPATYKRYRYSYGYDASNQLTSADYSYWVAGPGWQTSTNYDVPAIAYSRSGNRLVSQRRNESGALVENFEYAYLSGTNRLVEVENTAAPYQDIYSYHFDANGNVASIQNADYTQEVQFKYDASNRVIEIVDVPSGTTTDYRISASGWRYWSKTGSAYATYSPRDGAAPLGEFSVAYYTFTWNLRRPDGTVYGRKPYNDNSQFYWTDALGSVRMRTSGIGSLLEAHDYYPFGQDMVGRSSAGAPVRQGFTGYWRDHEAGLNLYYAGARQYDPTTGRFFGVDPLAEDFPTWSGYAYTLNEPVRWRDPDGRCPVGSQAGDIHDGSVCMQEIVVTAERIRQNNSLYSAIVIGGITADAAIIEPSDMLYLKWSFWGLAYIVASIIDEQLQNYAISFDDVWSISNKTDNPNIRSKRGGLEQAEEDFDSLGLGDVKSIPGGKVGVLPNGDRVVVREKSSDGRPTLEKHSNNSGNHKKIRYD